MNKNDREVVGGFICSKHTIYYKKQCPTCAKEVLEYRTKELLDKWFHGMADDELVEFNKVLAELHCEVVQALYPSR